MCQREDWSRPWGTNAESGCLGAQEAVSSLGSFVQQQQVQFSMSGWLAVQVGSCSRKASALSPPFPLSFLPSLPALSSHFPEAKPRLCRMHHNLFHTRASIFWVKYLQLCFWGSYGWIKDSHHVLRSLGRDSIIIIQVQIFSKHGAMGLNSPTYTSSWSLEC